MKIDIHEVGQRIRKIRERQQLTLEQLAKIIGRDKQTIWRWEKAERGISLKTIDLLAEKLDCPPSYLLGYNDDMEAGFEMPHSEENIAPCTFGQKMREYRKSKNLSVEETALALAVPVSRITELENRIDAPANKELAQIAQVLGVQQEELSAHVGTWANDQPPHAAVLDLARKMLEINPYLNLYLEQAKPTDTEANFLASAIRLAYEKKQEKK